jgi:hypothetical protein
MKENEILVLYNLDNEEYEVIVRPFITLAERILIVDSVVDNLFIQNYTPEYKDILFFKSIVEVMTNLDLPQKTVDFDDISTEIVDLESCYELMVKTNLIDVLCEADDRIKTIIGDLKSLIDEKLEYKKNLVYNFRDYEAIVNIIGDKFRNVNELVDGLNVLIDNLNLLSDTIDEKLSDLDLSKFDGLMDVVKSQDN